MQSAVPSGTESEKSKNLEEDRTHVSMASLLLSQVAHNQPKDARPTQTFKKI
jgi:hypothetical protein